jgi:hypothetical protein
MSIVVDTMGSSGFRSSLDTFGVPEIFRLRTGTWEGTYIKVNAQGDRLLDFQGTFSSIIDGSSFKQTNDYVFADGATKHLEFEGSFADGILTLDSPSYSEFWGKAWDGGGCVLFDCMKQQDGSLIRYFETIVYTGTTTRVRTTQEFANSNFVGVNFIQEIRK